MFAPAFSYVRICRPLVPYPTPVARRFKELDQNARFRYLRKLR